MKYIFIPILLFCSLALKSQTIKVGKDGTLVFSKERDTTFSDTIRCKFIVAKTDTTISTIYGYQVKVTSIKINRSWYDKNIDYSYILLNNNKQLLTDEILKIIPLEEYIRHSETIIIRGG